MTFGITTVAHGLKLLTLLLAFLAACTLPYAIGTRGRPYRTVMIFAVIELLFLGEMVGIGNAWQRPVIWYHAPLLLAASLIGLAYVIDVFFQRERDRRG